MSQPSSEPGEVTRNLASMQNGCPDASDRVWRLMQHRLAAIARRLRSSSPARHVWTDELVTTVYLKARRQHKALENSRAFLAFARLTIQRTLADLGRAERRRQEIESLSEPAVEKRPDERLFALVDALEELRRISPARAQVVELRGLLGTPHAEISNNLGISLRSSQRLWESGRAWLLATMSGHQK